MRISGFKRITTEQTKPEFRQVVDSIGSSVNSFADDVSNALNKNLTVTDNLNMEYKQVNVVVNGSGIPKVTTQFKSTLKTKVVGISVIKLDNLTNLATYPTGSPFVTFSENNKLITIQHVTGLVADNNYTLTLLSLGS